MIRYFPGKAQPGSETRAAEIWKTGLSRAVGIALFPGTFNVALMDDPAYGEPDVVYGPYSLWECEVSTQAMVARDEPGYRGWLLRVEGERLPSHFVEVISTHHLRKVLNAESFPSFIVEIGLNCSEQA